MIRFTDKEICCVMEKEMNRQQILEYFMNGHRGEIICILDENGKFSGSITYLSILGRELSEAVNRNCVILKEDAWEGARKCFERYLQQFGIEPILPVIDEERNLLCFAYQDNEADQELRMLDELTDYKSALGFKDVYPQYEHVTVHGCNELSYYFIVYLRKQGIPVSVSGELWENFESLRDVYKREDYEVIDYKNLNIYGEGVLPKDERLELRPSVSAEFECVDKIYENNILEGIIHDAEGNIEDVVKYFKGKMIAVLGADANAMNLYDFFIANGIDICCFISDKDAGKEIFGKTVVTRIDAAEMWPDIIFVQPDKKYSAWGFGETNLYHSLGYKRNRQFFLIQDYIELPENGLRNLLVHRLGQIQGRLVLTGDLWLCTAMAGALEKDSLYHKNIVFCDILQKYTKAKGYMPQIQANELKTDDFCLIMLPRYYACFKDEKRKVVYRKDLLKRYEEALHQYNITNEIDYPFEDVKWIRPNDLSDDKKTAFRPKRIILGAINAFSGNYLFGGIMEGHPDILKMRESVLSCNLYSFCVRLSMLPSCSILQSFWEMFDAEISRGDGYEFPDKAVFHGCMEELLKEKDRFTSQELFVILHIAYARMLGMITEDISNMTIYWEPHGVPREEVEHYAKWLDALNSDGYIVNVVRNSYMRAGSNFGCIEENRPIDRVVTAVYYPEEEKKEYENWKRIVLRFEDLKLNPKQEMGEFCEKTGLVWSDMLLNVKTSYKSVSGFDPAPVYRTWEEYFSSFDRFRISLITEPWQKRYDYPYVCSLDFNRRQLQEMFLKKFRFEENWVFGDQELENAFLKWRQKMINDRLWIVRRTDILG